MSDHLTYKPPLEEIFHALDVAGHEYDKQWGKDEVKMLFESAGDLASKVWAPLNLKTHIDPSYYPKLIRPEDPSGYSEVQIHPEIKDALKQYSDAGLVGATFPEEYGGMNVSWAVAMGLTEMFNSASTSISLEKLLTQGAAEAIEHHGSEQLKKRYLPKMAEGKISGTMLLTEPPAGSDLANVSLNATFQKDEDGLSAYSLEGAQKIFITWAEQDCVENIAHLVLARTGPKELGIKGISLFIVPKFHVDEDGNSTGKRNGIEATDLYEKMGIHASPTCQVSFGDKDPAIGYLVGEENKGMEYMFTMMNRARLSVGVQGIAIAERALQSAIIYASERKQGINLKTGAKNTEIINHPDIRNMILTSKVKILATRMMAYYTAGQLDKATKGDEKAKRQLGLFTPMVKAAGTDMAVDVASTAMQIVGGNGYIEEYGMAQFLADARITPIYEGTNGIQAMDLSFRKILEKEGKPLEGIWKSVGEMKSKQAKNLLIALHKTGTASTMVEWIEDSRAELSNSNHKTKIHDDTLSSLGMLKKATNKILKFGSKKKFEHIGAISTNYLHLFEKIAGGVMMAKSVDRMALIEKSDLDKNNLRIQMADIYADYILVDAGGLYKKIMDGADSILDVDMDQIKQELGL